MGFRSANLDHVATFNSAISHDLIEIYNNQLDEDIRYKSSCIPSRTFAPSSMRCKRKSWFRLRGDDPDSLPTCDRVLEFNAAIGTACHEMIQGRLISALKSHDKFEWVDVESYLQSIYPEDRYECSKYGYETRIHIFHPPIKFSCDGLLKSSSEYYLFEIKSCEYSAWNDLTEPKSEHIDQFNIYCTLLKINKGLFFYVDRQYGGIKCYEHQVPMNVQSKVFSDMKEVQEYAEFQIAPQGLPSGDPWCKPQMCPYFHKCREYGI